MIRNRDNRIDVFRGIAIFDMILVHYCSYFPQFISRMINYHDIAVEGFILFFGYSIGKFYFPKFIKDNKNISLRCFQRALKIFIIQYIMILTISIPHYALTNDGINHGMLISFFIQSITFQNQVGLMHILPMFIIFITFSPCVLFSLSKGWDLALIVISINLFLFGLIAPDFLVYGEKPIFPLLSWQVYFIGGCVWGKRSLSESRNIHPEQWTFFIGSLMLTTIALILKHSMALGVSSINDFKEIYSITISKFPLNVYGLAYGLSIWLFVISSVTLCWEWVKDSIVAGFLALFGRHSLLVFFIHVYFVKSVQIITHQTNISQTRIYLLIIMNIAMTYFVIKRTEAVDLENTNRYVRASVSLFK